MGHDRTLPARVLSIAIVDDDAGVRVSVSRLCRAFGLHAVPYASGGEFLAALDAGTAPADCLLVDAHMPTMTGFELISQLLARDVRIPTIVFTADATPAVPAAYVAAGISNYLRKPLPAADLMAAIESAVGGA